MATFPRRTSVAVGIAVAIALFALASTGLGTQRTASGTLEPATGEIAARTNVDGAAPPTFHSEYDLSGARVEPHVEAF
jgi:hypothetical protein